MFEILIKLVNIHVHKRFDLGGISAYKASTYNLQMNVSVRKHVFLFSARIFAVVHPMSRGIRSVSPGAVVLEEVLARQRGALGLDGHGRDDGDTK